MTAALEHIINAVLTEINAGVDAFNEDMRQQGISARAGHVTSVEVKPVHQKKESSND